MKPKKKKDYRKAGKDEKTNRAAGHKSDCHSSSSPSASSSSATTDIAVDRSAPSTGASPLVPEKNFARRKIVSNWDRYERTLSDELDDERQQRGRHEDFGEVLNASKSVGRQFRFRDELDWDKQLANSTTATVTAIINDEIEFGVLDVHDLVTAISCIPLHKRLNIDESYFTPELLSQFDIAASDATILKDVAETKS